MPHGLPDWGHTGPKETTFGLDDLGEHAVRLGSPHFWDRRGDVVYLSDFRDGFEAVEPYLVGASGGATLCCGHSRKGAYAVELSSDGVAACDAGIEIRMPAPVTLRLGVELSFTIRGPNRTWELWMEIRDRNRHWEMGIQYETGAWGLSYYNAAGVWTPWQTAVNVTLGVHSDQTIKLVVDTAIGQYVRLIFNDLVFPMTGLGFRDVGASVRGEWITRFFLHYGIGQLGDEWLDCVVLTQNEP